MKLLNVDAPRACVEAAIPHLTSSAGSVVNIADIAGWRPFAKHTAYSKTKAALIDLTRKKAVTLAPAGVRINAVCPGTILPPEDYSAAKTARLVNRIPLGRLGRPQELADAVLFLIRATYCTGQILGIDGGQQAADALLKRQSK